jgi:hypothetical protein
LKVFSDFEVLESVETISHRCFNYTFIAIKPRSKESPLTSAEREVMISQLSLLKEVYSETFLENIAFLFLSSSEEGIFRPKKYVFFCWEKPGFPKSILNFISVNRLQMAYMLKTYYFNTISKQLFSGPEYGYCKGFAVL